MKLVLSRRFGEPVPAPVTLPEIAPPVIAVATAAGVAFGLPWRYSAATPVTCGVAIDVPLNTFVCVSLPLYDDVIDWPSAKMSTQVPNFENDARASVLVVAPTVIACGVRAGDCVQASAFELPAAMAYVTPLAIDDCTDCSSVVVADPPRLMFATAGLTWLAVTQSTPAMTPETVPLPAQS